MRYTLTTEVEGHRVEVGLEGMPAFLFLMLVINTDPRFQQAFRPLFRQAHEELADIKIASTGPGGNITLNDAGRVLAVDSLPAILRALGVSDGQQTAPMFDQLKRLITLDIEEEETCA